MKRLFVANGLVTVRLVPELAMEIGLHESLILLQVDYLLSIRGVSIGATPNFDGSVDRWVKAPIRTMQEQFFPFWGASTISETIQGMIESRLLVTFPAEDNTRWLTYGPGCLTLESAKLIDVAESSFVAPKKPSPKPASKKVAEDSIYTLAQTLATVCSMDFEMNKGRLLKDAKAFSGHTRDEMLHLFYGPSSPWFLYDFRGQRGSFPTPGQVKSEWDKMARYHSAKHQTIVKEPDGGLNI